MDYHVYILARSKRGTMYTGMTSALEQRVSQHKLRLFDGHTKTYEIYKLVYYETYVSAAEASRREYVLKRYKRAYKYNLIEAGNPDWDDIASDWYCGQL